MTAPESPHALSARLVAALADPGAYPHAVDAVEVIETHISWVLLAGEFAYKIKKPVVLPFADFGTLAKRRECCEAEVRFNRRFAPQVYLGVVAITGSASAPRVGGGGPAIEYAVRMRRFAQDALFDRLLARGALEPALIDALAERIAAFHAAAPATSDVDFGTLAHIGALALDNFVELRAHADASRRAALDALENWTRAALARLEPVFAARHREGRVRECHGDLHLRNLALIDGEPVAFDCIEFNAGLRWIDVIDEVAFLVMDLMDRGRPELGWRFLDGYLARTGDYAGVAVLRFYLAYRALVRAKVHDLRARQAGLASAEARRLQAATAHYLELARGIAHDARPALIAMNGLSGAGKSRVAAALVESLGAIRVRADVERKRLFGMDGMAHSGSGVAAGIYTRAASEQTYARLREAAAAIAAAGYPAIIDAAFLARWQRAPLVALAERLRVPLRIVHCDAPIDVLRARVAARAARGNDPSEATPAVLERQSAIRDPLDVSEAAHAIRCDMQGAEAECVAACVARVAASLRDVAA